MTDNVFGKIDASLGGTDKAVTRSSEVTKWLEEIADAKKREKDFRKEGDRCVEICEAASGAEEGQSAYNILYANTETLAPALYNSVPRPVVTRRQKDGSVQGAIAAKVMQRTLEYLVDSNSENYSTFDDLQKQVVAHALVPGRGGARFSYEANISDAGQVTYETVCGDVVPWNRVYFGYASSWSKVPWQAFEHFMTREECIKNFGTDQGNAIKLTAAPEETGDKNDKLPADSQGAKFAHVWEIWDKGSKKVIFISEGLDQLIKTVDDPLKLTGFFPQPRPMVFLSKISSLIPKALYLMYETQARELNSISSRIMKILAAMKVRGFYDGSLTGLDELMKKEDNTLIAASNTAAMQQGQTLDKAIWFFPVERLVAVLQQLYVARQQCKQVIYEITGIADILRGSSQASETLGAQKMKEAWGTMRLKRMQKEVQRYARDSLRLMAELAANHFSPETFAAMTGMKFPTAQDKQQAQMMLQQAQMAQQQQPQGQPGVPMAPQPPQIPPQLMDQAKQTLSVPTWDDIVKLLRDDLHRNFIITIETNSTIDAEATEDKEQVSEYMNAMGQLLNGLAPLVEKGFMPFEVAKSLLLAVTQRFRFGAEVEDEIKKMQPPQARPGGPGADPKAAAEAKRVEMDMQHSQQLNQMALADAQAEAQVKAKERELKMADLAGKMQIAQAQTQVMMAKLSGQLKTSNVQAAVAEHTAGNQVRISNAAVKVAETQKQESSES